MSERDPRAELADIARSLRRVIERERPDGEMLLQSAGEAARQGRFATPAPPAPAASAPRAEAPDPAAAGRISGGRGASVPARPASPAPARHPDDIAPPITNLFGEPEPAAKPPYAPLDFSQPPLPSHHDPLAPVDAAARDALHAAALPVLDQIAAEARACRKCGLCETRTNAVPGVGSARTGIVFVGEAPGADEDAQGEPFVGRAGKLLTEIIRGMDERQLIPGVPLNRDTVYICNVLKCRPPENRNPLPHEIEQCSPYLHRQLEALNPRIICCLGKFAAELLVGVKGTIRDMRGKVYRYKGARLIVTYHPAAILRSPHQYRRPVWEDMQFLAREYLAD